MSNRTIIYKYDLVFIYILGKEDLNVITVINYIERQIKYVQRVSEWVTNNMSYDYKLKL